MLLHLYTLLYVEGTWAGQIIKINNKSFEFEAFIDTGWYQLPVTSNLLPVTYH